MPRSMVFGPRYLLMSACCAILKLVGSQKKRRSRVSPAGKTLIEIFACFWNFKPNGSDHNNKACAVLKLIGNG